MISSPGIITSVAAARSPVARSLFRSALEKVNAAHPVALSFFAAVVPLLPARLPFGLPMVAMVVRNEEQRG